MGSQLTTVVCAGVPVLACLGRGARDSSWHQIQEIGQENKKMFSHSFKNTVF